ncbi:hypothetical protein [Actinoplanes sp. TFC3]|uniref:hypothetical protein n=1 Tax=Actinoplanes sp. TFC3 TaxID=1710355 RepID=UPI0008299FB6|nr:hypothetical protein [Actinoplanes sp. TFC3]
MRKFSKRSAAAGGTGLVVLGVAGAAWAAWNLSGSGTAKAQAGTAVTLKVTGAGLSAGLTPGNATTVLLTVENRNAFPVRITDVDLAQLTSPTPGCDAAANVKVVDDAPLPDDATVPAGSTAAPASGRIAWAGALRMAADADDACQGAVFTFNVELAAVSAAP